MQFDLPKDKSSIIKVIGVGGGGSNAVNNMFNQGIQGVNFVISNTDEQAMELSPVPNKVQLGPSLTEGRGAGSIPDVGRQATEESIEEIKELLNLNTKMAFITAGMGGGTGTGGAPVIAKIAKEMGILTVGIVTMPFGFEGKRRHQQAYEGIEELKQFVDTIIVISNDKLREVYGNLKLAQAFAQADGILTTAAKGIAEIITVPGYVNVDFEDVKTVMTQSGVAIMGSAQAEGDHRALRAVEAALSSPLLSDNDIRGAKHILLNITSGVDEVTMDEIAEITDYVQEEAGNGTDVIWGNCYDEDLGEKIAITLIATGFDEGQSKRVIRSSDYQEASQKAPQPQKPKKVVHDLGEEKTSATPQNPHQIDPVPEEPVMRNREDEPEQRSDGKIVHTLDEEQEQSQAWASDDKQDDENTFVFDISGRNTEREDPPELKINLNRADQKESKTRSNPTGQVMENTPQQESVEPENHRNHNEMRSNEDPQGFNEQPSMMSQDEQKQYRQRQHSQKQEADFERIQRLRQMSSSVTNMKLSNPNTLGELESQPAYMRRNVSLNDTPHSSEQNASRYSVNENENGERELRRNNPFLHDNVD